MLFKKLRSCLRIFPSNTKYIKYTTASTSGNTPEKAEFENVFSFPFIKYMAMVNRLKVYQGLASCIVVPSCGILEMMNVIPGNTFYAAAYTGMTGVAVLSLFTLPFNNVIGQLYISEDNKQIKISSLNFFGKRIDKIVNVDDWVPLLDLAPKTTDAFYLSPQLTDGTKYKLFVKFGIVRNSHKMGQVLE
ncbi:transmembrane protein 186-like [Danaus plexippus]|uniref:transmembrane protein 186-like n=1 Tax=Danaus plexippus TaxID=13037 RepID=UPI002AB09DBE|nr:transmembrane protein 186-like [Danaus plexippus]